MHDFTDPPAFGVDAGSPLERDIQAHLNKQRMHEVKMFSSLRHDKLIGFRGVCVDEDGRTAHIILEPAEISLAEYVRRKKVCGVSLQEVVKAAQGMLDVLEYLHGQTPPVVIGDLTPHSFVMVPSDPDGFEVKLVDVGHAKFARNVKLPFAVTHELFPPPESQRDCCADMFCFAACLADIVCTSAGMPVRGVAAAVEALRRYCPELAEVIASCSSDDRDARLSAAAAAAKLRAVPVPDEMAALHHCESLCAHCAQPHQRVLVDSDDVGAVISYIRTFASNVAITAAALRTVAFLAGNTPRNQHLCRERDGVAAVCSALMLHPASVDVQHQGLLALGNLVAGNPDNQRVACANSCVDPVVAAMRAHFGNANIQVVGCWVLVCMGRSLSLTLASDAVQCVIDSMAQHTDHRLVQLYGCWTFAACVPVADSQETTAYLQVETAITAALERFGGDAEVVHRALAALLCTSRRMDKSAVTRWVNTHPDDARIQRVGSCLLAV
jgi:hypothetical protein